MYEDDKDRSTIELAIRRVSCGYVSHKQTRCAMAREVGVRRRVSHAVV